MTGIYRYVGPNDHYLRGGEQKLSPGDEVELDEDEISFDDYFEKVGEVEAEEAGESESEGTEGEESTPEEETEESGEEAAQNGDEVEAPFDPKDFSVDELEAELEGGVFSEEELDALEDAEKEEDPRTTALDVIEDANSGE